MPRGAVPSLPPDRMVEIAWDRWGRRGRYKPESIIAMCGPEMALPAVLARLAKDCPRRETHRIGERRGVRYGKAPQLDER